MALYRKKPVVIEATQFLRDGDHPKVWTVFIRDDNGAVLGSDIPFNTPIEHHVGYGIQTLEGWVEVTLGDWVIKGIKGEFYPCKPDIFAVTYEAVE